MQFENAQKIFEQHYWLEQRLLAQAERLNLSFRTFLESIVGYIAFREFRTLNLTEEFKPGEEIVELTTLGDTLKAYSVWECYSNVTSDANNPEMFFKTSEMFRPTCRHEHCPLTTSPPKPNLKALIGHLTIPYQELVALIRTEGLHSKRHGLLKVTYDIYLTGKGRMRNRYPQYYNI